MASINPDIFPKLKTGIKLSTRQDSDGNEIEVEVREDEDQSLKLQEIIDLLVAAGYFRARIKGLSSFDKVVGGITWCVESCNIDVDVDLLFQENLTIGQKIALTEKIVSVLPKMKCPHRIEPHQIQGLDFIHIFPVIQWLVKRSMEFREEMSAFVKSYAINQFNKQFRMCERVEKTVAGQVHAVRELYRPQRYYRRKQLAGDSASANASETCLQLTLLEYGNTVGNHSAGNTGTGPQLPHNHLEQRHKEELQIEQLMKSMTFASLEGNADIDILNPDEKEQLLKHYESLHAELKDGGHKSTLDRKISVLQQQKDMLEQQYKKILVEKENLRLEITDILNVIMDIDKKQEQANKTLKEIAVEEDQDPETIKHVEELVVVHEHLKEQEQQFREYCKSELIRLQTLIEEAQTTKVPEINRCKTNEELDEEVEKLKTLRLQIAKKSRAIAALQRQLDEVPSRAELSQYQRRFLELYNQVSAKHKETKQYYTLYNTLDDTRLYIRKELSLLNSILDSYPEAMQSSSGKDEFVCQFSAIVGGVRQTLERVQQRCADERAHRDGLSARLRALVDQQRRYVAALRQLGIECRRNEALLSSHHP